MTATRYPVFLDLTERLCLVVGGGKVATRKVESLLEAGAKVRLVSPKISGTIADHADVEWLEQAYDASVLDGAGLVVACTDDDAVNEQVWQDCRARGLWCNVVDDPPRCDFYVPAVVQRGRLQIAVSTNGASPAMAGSIRRELEASFDESFDELLERVWQVRLDLLANQPDEVERRRVLKAMGSAESLRQFRDGGLSGWRQWCKQNLGVDVGETGG